MPPKTGLFRAELRTPSGYMHICTGDERTIGRWLAGLLVAIHTEPYDQHMINIRPAGEVR